MQDVGAYNPGQFKQILRFVQRRPHWLVLGGPANGDEAQFARKRWPRIRIVGIEPFADSRDWQRRNGWPEDAPLVDAALWDSECLVSLMQPPDGPNRLAQARVTGASDGASQKVSTRTIDSLDREFGPFSRGILWLDIEGSEHRALLGAEQALARQAFSLINVETNTRTPENTENIHELLLGHGYSLAGQWQLENPYYFDRVYTCQK